MNIEQLISMNADLISKIMKLEQASNELQVLAKRNEQLEIRVNQLQAEKKTLESVIRNLQNKTGTTASLPKSYGDVTGTYADTSGTFAHAGGGWWDQDVVDSAKAARASISGGTDSYATLALSPKTETGTTTFTIIPNHVYTSPTIAGGFDHVTVNPAGLVTGVDSAVYKWDGASHRGTTYTITGLADPAPVKDAVTKSFLDVMIGESMIATCSNQQTLENLIKIADMNIPVPKSAFFTAMGVDQNTINDRKIETGVPDNPQYLGMVATNSWSSKWDNMAHSSMSSY